MGTLDLKGKKFGKLKVIKKTELKSKWGSVIWGCKCECGNFKNASSLNLKWGNTKSCGCLLEKARKRNGKLLGQRNFINLKNQRFGKLEAISKTKERSPAGDVRWICKCDCGKMRKVNSSSLIHGNTKSCGCLKKGRKSMILNLKGNRYGRWVVLNKAIEANRENTNRWQCICDCGTIRNVKQANLIYGGSKSCGCYAREHQKKTIQKKYDLKGQRFGRLVVKKKIERRTGRNFYWECRCDCGRACCAVASSLRTGKKKHCGCQTKEILRENGRNQIKKLIKFNKKNGVGNFKDLTGKKYGRLIVLKRCKKKSSGGNVKWICRCKCGNYIKTTSTALKTGTTKSCGCYQIYMAKKYGRSDEGLKSIATANFMRTKILKKEDIPRSLIDMFVIKAKINRKLKELL